MKIELVKAAAGLYLQMTSAAQDGGWFGFEVQVCPVLASMFRVAFSAFSLVKSFHCLKYSCFSPPLFLERCRSSSSSRLLFFVQGHQRRTPPHHKVTVACNLTPLTLAERSTYLLLDLAAALSSSRLVAPGLRVTGVPGPTTEGSR